MRHLARLSDANGIFEHALFEQPRKELGYCTDDAGRLLRVATRLPWSHHSAFLSHLSLHFLKRAYLGDGQFHLRQKRDGAWTDDPPSDDANGRALLGLAMADAARRAASWFLGDDDLGVAMFDSTTGGGFDGLEPGGVNRNEGAESSMAFVGAMTVLAHLTGEPAMAPDEAEPNERLATLQAARSASSR
jgi:hypothetical protein